ncbi:hypothetical protein QP691_14695, partial [Escherichia coli]|nr:hypothetical protein [Escherichia coli]MDK8063196.1 hypothetical protein [Escherichia coli]
TGSYVPLWETEYGVLSLPTMIGEDPHLYSIHERSSLSATDRYIAPDKGTLFSRTRKGRKQIV